MPWFFHQLLEYIYSAGDMVLHWILSFLFGTNFFFCWTCYESLFYSRGVPMVFRYNQMLHCNIPMLTFLGWWVACLKRLIVNSICTNRLSHIYVGKSVSTPDRIAIKCALNFLIALSAIFHLCTFGGTSWYVAPQSFIIVFLNSVLTSLSNICMSTWCPLSANFCMIELYALILCLSLLLTKGAWIIVCWITMICYHGVFISTSWSDGESSAIISVQFTDWLVPYVDFFCFLLR